LKIAIEEMHCKRDSLLDCQDDLTKAYYSIKKCMEENRYEHSMEEIFEGLYLENKLKHQPIILKKEL